MKNANFPETNLTPDPDTKGSESFPGQLDPFRINVKRNLSQKDMTDP